MTNVWTAFQKFMKQNNILKSNKVLVALSGGPDSVATLHLCSLYFDNVVAVHVNHNLREEESENEEMFCKELCLSLNIPLYVKKLTEEEKKNGTQEKYRILRYKFFEHIFQSYNCNYLIVGHHKNDQSETVFYNIMKGAGIEGLSGIKAMSINFGMNIMRPLLTVTKDDIYIYLKNNNLNYKVDSSNLKNKYSRNKIRNQIIPMLDETFSVNMTESLSKISYQMTLMQDMLNHYNKDIDSKLLTIQNDKVSINVKELYQLHHVAVISNYYYYFLKEHLKLNKISSIYIEQLLNLIQLENSSIIQLPNQYVCEKKGDYFYFYIPKSGINSFNCSLNFDNNWMYIPNLDLHLKLEYVDSKEKDGIYFYLPNDSIQQLSVCSYEEGSKIYYNEHQRKKIKKLVKEKSDLKLEYIWYLKDKDEPIIIPPIDYCSYKYKKHNAQLVKLSIR